MLKDNLNIFRNMGEKERHGGVGRNSLQSLVHATFLKFHNCFLIFISFYLFKMHRLFMFQYLSNIPGDLSFFIIKFKYNIILYIHNFILFFKLK